jgi:single-strand DNA-binding protein
MNDLNSVLLEGILTQDPQQALDHVEFVIETAKKTTEGTAKARYTIQTTGRLAEVCQEYLTAGRGVRIVGRLGEHEGKVIIEAEHVEIKPMKGAKS